MKQTGIIHPTELQKYVYNRMLVQNTPFIIRNTGEGEISCFYLVDGKEIPKAEFESQYPVDRVPVIRSGRRKDVGIVRNLTTAHKYRIR